ncbi:MAG: hypothetical protein WB554_10205 [Desulfomonilaceae bacterium]
MKFFIMFVGLLAIIVYSTEPSFATDQTLSIIANQQVCHILEDSPSCTGIAPQQSQSADLPLNATLSMKASQNFLKSSKTNMDMQRTYKELSGRVKGD